MRNIRIVEHESGWMLMVGNLPLLLMTNEEVYALYLSAKDIPREF